MTVYDKAAEPASGTYGEWSTRRGRPQPARRQRRAAAPGVLHFLALVRGEGDPARGCQGRAGGRAQPRAAPGLARTRARLTAQIAETAVVYPGTELGEGVVIGDYAVVGKAPTLGPRSTASGEPLPPPFVGDGTAILAGAVVFAGTRLGSGVIVGDHACVRERCTLGDEVVMGVGSLLENDTTVGARTRIQANACRHRVLDARGGRLHRALCRHYERQLHGKNGYATHLEAARSSVGGRVWAVARCSFRESRSARRPFVGAGASFRKTSLPERWWSATRRGESAPCPKKSSSSRRR